MLRTKLFPLSFIFLWIGCRHSVYTVKNEYHYHQPDYGRISLMSHTDTLVFNLGEKMYNDIKSFNCFTHSGMNYISFYDRRSETINIYYLMNQSLYKRISIKKILKNRQLYKTSVFIKNWDSIFIINKFHINLYDSSGYRKQSIEFPVEPKNALGMFDSNKLPVSKDNKLFVIVRPYVSEKSIDALRECQVLYSCDFNKKSENVQLHFHLPEIYQNQFYGYHFLDYNFCYNNRNKFVFSFPADTLLYETDLNHYNHSYYAQSKLQRNVIQPVTKQALEDNQGFKEYVTRDSYGSVFFDQHKKYYLRLARHSITTEEFASQKKQKQTVLIFDEDFRIIGESDWPSNVDFDSLFFTQDGQIYARTNFKDENALHFVRFDYRKNADSLIPSAGN